MSSAFVRFSVLNAAAACALLVSGCGADSKASTSSTTSTTAKAQPPAVTGAYAVPMPPRVNGDLHGLVYLDLVGGDSDDVLVEATVDGNVAASVELHETAMADAVAPISSTTQVADSVVTEASMSSGPASTVIQGIRKVPAGRSQAPTPTTSLQQTLDSIAQAGIDDIDAVSEQIQAEMDRRAQEAIDQMNPTPLPQITVPMETFPPTTVPETTTTEPETTTTEPTTTVPPTTIPTTTTAAPTTTIDELIKMRPVDGIPVAAGATVPLRPGGMHVFLSHLTKAFVVGESFELTLVFASGGEVTVTVPIKAA